MTVSCMNEKSYIVMLLTFSFSTNLNGTSNIPAAEKRKVAIN